MDEMRQLIQQQLESSDIEFRIAAARQLSRLPAPSMRLFSLCLGDEDWRVRKAAVETFYQLDPPGKFIPDLIKLLYHPENAGLRNAAIEILIGLGSQVVDELQREISKPDVEVRKFVIDILGEIGDSRCTAELIRALEDADINVRYAAAETLGKLRVSAAVTPLLELMADPDPGLKFTILQSLAQIGGAIPIERLFLYLEDRILRKALFECFAKVGGPEVIPHLVNGLSDPMRQVREAALGALDCLSSQENNTIKKWLAVADTEQIASDLERIISGDRPHLKVAALALYGAVGSRRDLSLVLDCVAEEGLRPQVLTVFAELGEGPYVSLINSTEAFDPLQQLSLVFIGGELCFASALPLAIEAARAGDTQLRSAAARALGALGREDQFALLLHLLDDEVIDIQNITAVAIARYAKRYKSLVLTRISSMLADPDADKRMRVARILGLIGGEETEKQLLKAFKDSASHVRCEAIRALGGHFSEAVISGLTLALTDESTEVRRLAVNALSQCSQEKALPALTLAAGDADLWVRSSVMRALALYSGDGVRDLLLQGVADSVGLVVISALESSVVVIPEQCQELLENVLTHPDEEVVKAAMSQLARFAGKHWIDSFGAALLNHPHWDVRLHAVRSLGQSFQLEWPRLLEKRLVVETEDLVRQAIESVLSGWLNIDSQGC